MLDSLQSASEPSCAESGWRAPASVGGGGGSGRVGGRALQLLCRRAVPLGFMPGWMVLARRRSSDDDANAPEHVAAPATEAAAPREAAAAAQAVVVRRFEWEEHEGRAGWDKQRKAARVPMEPAGSPPSGDEPTP